MFFGIVEFGRILQAYLTVQHSVREAARYAVTGQGGVTMEERVRSIKEKAVEATAGINVGNIDWREGEPLDAFHCDYENVPNALCVLVYAYRLDEEGNREFVENYAGDPGEHVLVKVYFNYEPLTPFFSSLFPYIRLTGQMDMINEGFGPTGASHGGVLPPTLVPVPEIGPYPSETLFTDSLGASVDQYILGEDLVFVTVTDKDENFDLGSRDTVTVIVRDKITGGDSETLILTEIGPNSGVFRNTTGLPSTSTFVTPASNNVLETGPGHVIVAEYEDDDDSTDTSDDKARMIGIGASWTGFTDGGGTPVIEYLIGEHGIYVTVGDSDENTRSNQRDEVSVTITDSQTGDSQRLTLTETGADTGVFRNTVGLPSTLDPGASDDGTLNTGIGSTITAEYTDDDDPGDSFSATALMLSPSTLSTISFTDSGGGEITQYTIGVDGIFVTVEDADENTNSLTRQEIPVTVTDGATGDSEMLVLIETGFNTGIFRNAIAFSSGLNPVGIPDNGLLETQNGHTITVRYTDDEDGADTSTDTATMFAEATRSTVSFTDSGGAEVSMYNIDGDGIYVTVRDGDENANSSLVEEVSVTVTDGETGDSEMLTLRETGPNTGVFRNTEGLSSSSGSADLGNGTLETQGGSTITVRYADDDDGTDTSSDTAIMGVQSTTRFTDSGGVDVTQYALGVEGIYVTVEDADENTDSGLAETISVTVSDSETGDSEVLTLTETGADTGVFRNTEGLSSISGAGSSGNGTLNTASGSTITAVYVDKDGEADTASDTAVMVMRTPSTTSFTDNVGAQQAEYYLGTQLIYVTVEDADENINSSVRETVSVIVMDEQTGDSETLTLYETEANSGVFRSSVGLASTRKLVGVPGNNLLETQPDNTITARYTDDDHPGDTSSAQALMRKSDRPPDLVVTNITVEDTNLVVGVPVSITVTVRNQNEGSVTSTLFDIDFYIYTDLSSQPTKGRPGDAKQWYTENVPGGAEIQLVYSIAFPQEGTLYLYAQVDTTDRVAEADETNNIYLLEPPYVTVDVGCYVLFDDDMESGGGGWTAQEGRDDAGDTAPFEIIEYGSGNHVWWVDNAVDFLQTYLMSPETSVPSGMANVQLRFWQAMIAEENYDGGWLEYRIDGGGWNDVTADMFGSGGYNGQTSSDCPSCGGTSHEAWTGQIPWWQEVVANVPIPDATVEHTIQFRWHFECDGKWEHLTSPNGWWIDNVMVGNCQEPPPPPPPGSDDCVTAFQDNFSGTLSQWSVSNPDYVHINSGRLRLRVAGQGQLTREWAQTATLNLSGYEWVTLSYSWWTGALDGTDEWGRVRVSDDGGANWKAVTTYHGTDSGSASITLPGAYGVNLTSNFMIEFRVRADRWEPNNYERFEVDNVVLDTCTTVPPPPPQAGTGVIRGTTRYYDENFGQYFYVSGVDVWATQVNPPGDTYSTYSLTDYTYGFWNLPAGLYDIYAESIINNDLYNDFITGVQVQDGITATQHILLEMVY
jgi:hypothetical protein